ncbi:hypothetical protein [Glaciecola sp. MF2-115]|uniref:hypothetical protein n=1 Tax=Glaciecola sp. MF2-115 TaxID=3384827 RepID=UPI00399F2242
MARLQPPSLAVEVFIWGGKPLPPTTAHQRPEVFSRFGRNNFALIYDSLKLEIRINK